MPEIKIKDLKVHYVDEGKGDVIILIHGNYSSSYWWTDIIDRLKDTFRLIAPDLRGRGNTQGKAADHTVEMLSDDLNEFLKAINITEPFDMVGHSLGASVATQFALDNIDKKEMIKHLVMIDPGWVEGDIPDSIADVERLEAVADDEQLLRTTIETLIAPNHPTGEYWENLLKESSKQAREATMRSGEVYQMWNVVDQLEKINDIPVLIMRGELDKFFSPQETSDKIMSKITNAKYFVIEGVGHSPVVEAPDMLVKHIKEFISE